MISRNKGSTNVFVLIGIVIFIIGGFLLYQYWWLPIDQPTKPVGILSPTAPIKIQEEGKETEILNHLQRYPIEEATNWNFYYKPEVTFSFKYSNAWTIVDEFYYKDLSGVKWNRPTVTLHKINGSKTDWIFIYMPRFQYEGATWVDVESNHIGTYSRELARYLKQPLTNVTM